jgi:hypothetical protein
MAEHAHEHDEQANPLQGYYEWQVTTLMLAYDLVQPIARGAASQVQQRRQDIEREVSDMVLQLIPEQYKQNPDLDWPPQLMMRITRATLQRAAEIAKIER